MKELFSVVTVQEAKKLISAHLPQFCAGDEERALLDAVNCRLAQDIFAGEDLPPFSRSSVDGYAVRARDTFGVSETTPGFLKFCGEILMGECADRDVEAGEAVWIPTGGMAPTGADAVVMVEYTQDVGAGLVTIHRPVSVGENLISRGEDCRKDSKVLYAGTRLRSAEIGMLAGLGITKVQVQRQLRIGIISTGDEVVGAHEQPRAGQIRDINSYALGAQVIEGGALPICYGIVSDDEEKLQEALDTALKECDMVLLSGGSSVGTRDLTSQILGGGSPGILFHGIAIKPGKPTLCAIIGGKPVLGLPGHPASAMVVFRVLIDPLLRWGSYLDADKQLEFSLEAELSHSLASGPGREDYIRVKLELRDNKLIAVPVLGKSGLISTLVQADGIIKIPMEKEGLNTGSRVTVAKI